MKRTGEREVATISQLSRADELLRGVANDLMKVYHIVGRVELFLSLNERNEESQTLKDMIDIRKRIDRMNVPEIFDLTRVIQEIVTREFTEPEQGR